MRSTPKPAPTTDAQLARFEATLKARKITSVCVLSSCTCAK